MRVCILEKFFEYHTDNDPYGSAESLSFSESIGIIVDIDWHLDESELMLPYLVDELTRVLHAIHCDPNLIEYINSHHTISIVSIREMDSGDQRSKYSTTPKYEATGKWNIGIGFDDKP